VLSAAKGRRGLLDPNQVPKDVEPAADQHREGNYQHGESDE